LSRVEWSLKKEEEKEKEKGDSDLLYTFHEPDVAG
jgi:hypothetical protein